jgi:MFS superfamily sulfate permease-like transporter
MTDTATPPAAEGAPASAPRLPTLRESWPHDLLAGFLVFLIALPLCLAISRACGYPAIAGVFTAIIGGVITTFISNSELTIKGPAAGLIVIAIGCVESFGGGVGDNFRVGAYRLALGVGVAAAVLQILSGFARLGNVIGDFFPKAAVHGMLASIGVVIALKQFFIVLGVAPLHKSVLGLFADIPYALTHPNPEIATIGVLSLLILFGLPLIKNRVVRRIPAPMVVVVVAILLGQWFNLDQKHGYLFLGQEYTVGPKALVDLPKNMFDGIAFPDFHGLLTWNGWKFVLMFFLVGSLESLLSAKAIDIIDPWRRKTNLNRDLTAIGVANLASACVGGLPMISEIVRSKANIDNGARTRQADLFHALFLFGCVALVPGLLHEIPLAALAAMLVYTGYRLAAPREFVHAYKVGAEQLIIFLVTLGTTLATDLLMGIAAGVVAKFVIHLLNGAPLRAMVKPPIAVEAKDDRTVVVSVRKALVFSNWLWLKGTLDRVGPDKDVVLDLSETRLVDHTVMESLHEMGRSYEHAGRKLVLAGLEQHRPLSSHPHAARKKSRGQLATANGHASPEFVGGGH